MKRCAAEMQSFAVKLRVGRSFVVWVVMGVVVGGCSEMVEIGRAHV